VRSPANCETGVDAFEAAAGGTLCVRRSPLPRDFAQVVARLRDPNTPVQLVIGAERRDARHAFLTVPAPIHIPSLRARAGELPRIVDEYARDAAAELSIRDVWFSDADRRWVLEHAAASLSEIEKAALRLVALKISANVSQAAARLGMAAVSLSRWIGRRKLPPASVAAAATGTAER
jgi:ActR/RegA family two-component response regulator